jgi:Leucine-rich repeat (LRR) protein
MNRLLFFFVVSINFCVAQNIVIPDNNFRNALLQHQPVIDTNGDGQIQVVEAQTFDAPLIVNGYEITDLNGIQYFVNIPSLECRYNNLNELDISNNTSLTYLDAKSNGLNSLIIGNAPLITLIAGSNYALSVVDLSSITTLERLDLINNNITNLNISTLMNLKKLDLSFNSLTSLDVSETTALETLKLNRNSITSLDINALTELKFLNLQGNLLTNLDLSTATELESLWLSDNSLTDLDLSNSPIIVDLRIERNLLSNLDTSNLLSLESLLCSNNSLTNLDVSNQTLLQNLQCGYNNLDSLDISHLSNIAYLNCENNQITELSITSDKFQLLRADNNLLSSFEINAGSSTSLQDIFISHNQLIDLDLSSTKLRYLDCSNNPVLESINMRNGWNWVFSSICCNSSFENLPALNSVCLDYYGGNYITINFILGQVGHPVEFFNNEDCTELTLDISENELELKFVVSPNPASTTINIVGVSDRNEIIIYNQLGQIVLKEMNTTNIDVSSLKSGIYFVKIIDENTKQQVKKLLKV